jgi:hypothetical protein
MCGSTTEHVYCIQTLTPPSISGKSLVIFTYFSLHIEQSWLIHECHVVISWGIHSAALRFGVRSASYFKQITISIVVYDMQQDKNSFMLAMTNE